jgi:hypothetical protein
LLFIFGTAGVTVVAAQQSRPGEPLDVLMTRSSQFLRQEHKTQVHARQIGNIDQTHSRLHLQEHPPQNTAVPDLCTVSGLSEPCGSDQINENSIQKHHGTEPRNNGANHQNDGNHHKNHESDHGHEGHDDVQGAVIKLKFSPGLVFTATKKDR